nr:deaminase [Dissulfurirhabdus thermomarina]
MSADRRWMGEALALARQALAAGEFPVGCVLVAGGRVVGRGRRVHTRPGEVNELDHGEMVALRQWLSGGAPGSGGAVTVYTTLEPCLMCLGALVLNGVRRIVYAYEDVMGGATGLLPRVRSGGGPGAPGPTLYTDPPVTITAGVERGPSLSLFRAFFADPANDYWRESPLARYTLSAAASAPRGRPR